MRGVGGFGFVAPFLAPFACESPGVDFGSERMGKAPKKLARRKTKQGSEGQEGQDQASETQK